MNKLKIIIHTRANTEHLLKEIARKKKKKPTTTAAAKNRKKFTVKCIIYEYKAFRFTEATDLNSAIQLERGKTNGRHQGTNLFP